MRLTLSACPPFSLHEVINSHGWVQLPPFATDPQSESLIRTERLATGRVVELRIREAMGGVNVEVRERLTGREREEASRKVWWMLGLGEDLSSFYAAIDSEPQLHHIRSRAMGRILRSPTVFEDVAKTILTTNTSWSGTIRMVKALVAEFGDPVPTDPSRHAFPTPAQIAAASEEELRQIGLGYRAPFVYRVALRTVSGDLKLESFKRNAMPTPEMYHQLLEIKGIGEYAAASLLMLLGRFDYVPVDSWARKLVSQEWYEGEPVGREEVERAFERWGSWKGLVYWFWNWSHSKDGEQ